KHNDLTKVCLFYNQETPVKSIIDVIFTGGPDVKDISKLIEAITWESQAFKISSGADLNINNCVNLDYSTFANGTPNGFDATSNGSATHEAGTADEINLVSGQKYTIVFDEVLNSGTAPYFNITKLLGGEGVSSNGGQLSSNGNNVFTFTANWTGIGTLQFYNTSAATDFEITNLSVKDDITGWNNLNVYDISFDDILLYNDDQCSGYVSLAETNWFQKNKRTIVKTWNFDEFRDLVVDNKLIFLDGDLEPNGNVSSNKNWQDKNVLTGKHIIVRFRTNNTLDYGTQHKIILNNVNVNAKIVRR
ncbi:hypothetical protein LCGC14_2324450, partial [marine sediment metagenome]